MMERHPLHCSVSLVALLASSGPLLADGGGWTLVDQTRRVLAIADASGTPRDSDIEVAPGFDPFSDTVSASVTNADSSAQADASQDSTLFSDGLTVIGSASGNAQTTLPEGFASGSGESLTHVVFTIAAPMTWSLTGNVALIDQGSLSVSLFDSGTTHYAVGGSAGPSPNGDVSAFGTLPAGTHELRIQGVSDGVGIIGLAFSGSVDFGLVFRLGTPGVGSCYGTAGCPCGNDDPAAGCVNSTGSGGLLAGSGSASVAADDLLLTATGLPLNNNGLFYMGDTRVQAPFFDGFQCALGTTFRFLSSIQSTGVGGTMTLGTGIISDSGTLITAGSTWHFHAWHRDVPGSPCGTGANLTNLYSVTFTP